MIQLVLLQMIQLSYLLLESRLLLDLIECVERGMDIDMDMDEKDEDELMGLYCTGTHYSLTHSTTVAHTSPCLALPFPSPRLAISISPSATHGYVFHLLHESPQRRPTIA